MPYKCTLNRLIPLLALAAFNILPFSLSANDCCCETVESRVYIGAFGGGLYSDSTKLSQVGTAFLVEASGGPLAVNAKGHSKKNSFGFGGVQLGYERSMQLGCSDWVLAPAAEIEAFFYKHKQRGDLINDSDRLEEHDFVNSFNLDTSVCLINAVFSLNNDCMFGLTPYVGGGVGAAHLALKNAKSIQISPAEPGLNHYNSNRNDSSWAFAAQAKAGLRYNICNSLHIFAEYRYLFVDSSNYLLGSTSYPGHAVTSPWNVKVNDTHYQAFTFGIQYDL